MATKCTEEDIRGKGAHLGGRGGAGTMFQERPLSQPHGRCPAVEKTNPLLMGSREEKPNQKGLALREHVTP